MCIQINIKNGIINYVVFYWRIIMGGTALLAKAGIESQRLTMNEFNRVKSEVHAILDDLKMRWLDVDFIREKTDFGDIDIIVIDDRIPEKEIKNNNSPAKIILDNIDKFGITDKLFINNTPFASLLYEGKYQVDFITVKPECAKYTQAYLSHNDLGNLLGRTIKRFNMTHAMDGLFYDHYINNRTQRHRFLISTDPHEILRILNLDIEKFEAGFDTYKEMFDYVQGSKYFNPELFKFENLNNRNRVRDKKRKVYNQFLQYINYDVTNDLVYNPADDYPWIPARCEEYTAEWHRRAAIRAAVPGPVVMARTGLQGKELGSLIGHIRETYQDALIGITEDALNEVIDTSYVAWQSLQNDH